MITKIFEDGKSKITAWTDTPESLVKAVHEAIFVKKESTITKVTGNAGEIKNIRGDWYTSSEDVKKAALAQGYWLQKDFLGTEILFTWSRDPKNPPNNSAYHS